MYAKWLKAIIFTNQKLGDIIVFQGKGSPAENKIGSLETWENPNIITIDQTQFKFDNVRLRQEKSDARINRNF